MKKCYFVAAAAALFAMGSSSFAQTTTATSNAFNVTVSLTPLCNVKTQPGNLSFGAYTPFAGGGAAVPSPSTSMVFQCSQGLTPTKVGLDLTSGSDATVSTPTTGVGATAVGVLTGLRYTLAVNAVGAGGTYAAGTAASTGSAGTGGNNSTAQEYTFNISANMPAGQAGGVSSDSAHSYTLTLTY